ncbi:FIST signal transduction protein [Algibacillus agarilyticus]|uniref:FIST signal transduction protein n=1 Tax=Algibacillus agarilyticus TaxID=2234133 RepID=UPI000DCF7030|nr:FIST N-terminal domain-containing protein [Algibacillus agarilyticus]
MKNTQYIYQADQWDKPLQLDIEVRLVLLFGCKTFSQNNHCIEQVRAAFPNAEIIGCTSSGDIAGNCLYDESLIVTAIEFSTTKIRIAWRSVIGDDITNVCNELAAELPKDELKYALVLSDGHSINGSELVSALVAALPEQTILTGGLAGDGMRFKETTVWYNDKSEQGRVLVCGLYGEDLVIGHGTKGGWDPFGPVRTVTKSKANCLYQLDGKPALTLYKDYLGVYAEQLPASAMRFPLLLTDEKNNSTEVIRTILEINEAEESMMFAGDIPEGAKAQLMRANFDRLIDGAEMAAMQASAEINASQHSLVLLISCLGRRVVLNQRTEEELEAVVEELGTEHCYCGFYSYGEIAPLTYGEKSTLHNQTMTITIIAERNA